VPLAYSFDPETGAFIAAVPVFPSPLELGKFLAPINTTPAAPPATAEHEIALYKQDLGGWIIAPDFRGEVRYSTTDGAQMTVSDIGPLAEVAPDTCDTPRPARWYVWSQNALEWLPDQAAVDEETARRVKDEAQRILDDFARVKGYDSITSLCSYATSTDETYAAEAQYAVTVRDAVWHWVSDYLDALATDGVTEPPPAEAFAALLPPANWPEQ